jgi:hypothetical protein
MQKIKNLEDTISSLISPKTIGIGPINNEVCIANYTIDTKMIQIRFIKNENIFQVHLQVDENSPLEMIFEGELNQFNPTTLLD